MSDLVICKHDKEYDTDCSSRDQLLNDTKIELKLSYEIINTNACKAH